MYSITEIKFYTIVAVHHLVAAGLVICPIISAFLQPWYVTFMLTAFAVRTATSRDVCILTEAEKKLRQRLGLPEMKGGFVGHYFLRRRHKNEN